jgi:phosphoserine phosphatase RsbU/P
LKPLVGLKLVDEAVERQLEQIRLYRLNQRYHLELEAANKVLHTNLDVLRADQRAGRHIQLKLFPERHVRIEQFCFDHAILPSLYLSGDFLDYFHIDDRYIVFYLADVSGHGASSAFVTVLLKNLTNRLLRNLRRGSSNDIRDPVRFLKRVNRELLDTALGKHLTMFAGLLDTQSRTLTYTLGAHFPMPILKVGDKVSFLQGQGMPVGLFENVEFETYQLELPVGFSLLLFSDGILEVTNGNGLAAKEQQLLELVGSLAPSVDDLKTAFGLRDILELPDDIAIMTITEAVVNNVQL